MLKLRLLARALTFYHSTQIEAEIWRFGFALMAAGAHNGSVKTAETHRLDFDLAGGVPKPLISTAMCFGLRYNLFFPLRHQRPGLALIYSHLLDTHFAERHAVDIKLPELLHIILVSHLILFVSFSILQCGAEAGRAPLHQLCGLQIFIIWQL